VIGLDDVGDGAGEKESGSDEIVTSCEKIDGGFELGGVIVDIDGLE